MRIAMANITLGGMSGGYRMYLREILPRLEANDRVHAILCAAPAELNVPEWFDDLGEKVTFADSGYVRLLGQGPRASLAKAMDAFKADVLFVPLARPLHYGRLPVVNMVQNMEPLAFDQRANPLSERLKNALRRRAMRIACSKADGLIAVSQYARDFLVQQWGLPASEVCVARYGPVAPAATLERPAAVPKEWDGQFLFTAGAIRPARGLEDLLGAMAHLKSAARPVRLIIAGAVDSRMDFYRRRLDKQIADASLTGDVLWTGSLPKEQMDWCYTHSRLFVMTSRVESFGIIAIEAMSCGCVCIAADNPCLPEVFGPAATLYPPKDSAALADRIAEALDVSSDAQATARAAAKARAGEFSWDDCARTTIDFLQRIIQTRANSPA